MSETSITGQNNNTLGSEVFLNAGSLSDVKLPTNLTQIQNSTFASTALTSFDLSQTKITSIPDGAFQSCASLSTITLPTGLTNIGNNAFQGSGISTINLEATQVNTIGQGAFANTTQLKTLKVPNTLTNLNSAGSDSYNDDTSATFYQSGITELDLSNTHITSIAAYTFSGAAKLASVTLPAGLTSIGNKAFYGTTVLKTLKQGKSDTNTNGKLTSSVQSIGTYAFAKTGLASIDLSETKVTGEGNVTSLGNSVFQEATSLTTLNLPITLTTIPAGMVAGATSLKSLTIPASVTKINGGNGQYPGAFQGSGLESIDLSTATGLAT